MSTFTEADFYWRDPSGKAAPMSGLCGHCQIQVDSFDPNHRVTSIVNGGRGVECVLRGDITAAEGGPLRVAPATEQPTRNWREPLGLHDLDATEGVAKRLAATYECTQPAGGLGPGTHCAACCYNTGIAANSMEEFETAQVLLAVPELVAEIRRLRA